MDRLRSCFLDRNGPDFACPLEIFRALAANESGQGPDRSKPLITGGRTTFALLFQLLQESSDDLRG
jgi:hypothetical protein